MLPFHWLSLTTNFLSDDKLPRELGIGPEKELLDRDYELIELEIEKDNLMEVTQPRRLNNFSAALLHLASVYCSRTLKQDDQTLHTEFSAPFSWRRYSAKSSSQGSNNGEHDPIYGVSDRLVPQGPNPLHN
ncbi:hypothetical protein IFM89_030210 [Coptis chinensis]|uniref:Uncharacterized protein n=1 Tax=Coptis chinensis TaxID=261450 RepID=A0A835LTA5_9MAGN|nr:hypothetical protein IFM89_030210 [Coptis chinensis]